jgi:hypothetical protein
MFKKVAAVNSENHVQYISVLSKQNMEFLNVTTRDIYIYIRVVISEL